MLPRDLDAHQQALHAYSLDLSSPTTYDLTRILHHSSETCHTALRLTHQVAQFGVDAADAARTDEGREHARRRLRGSVTEAVEEWSGLVRREEARRKGLQEGAVRLVDELGAQGSLPHHPPKICSTS